MVKLYFTDAGPLCANGPWLVLSIDHILVTPTASSCFVPVLTTFLCFDIIGPDSTCQHPSVKTYSGSTASKVFMHTCSVVSLYTVAPVFLWDLALSSISSKPSDLCLHLEVERNVPTSISCACLWLRMLLVIGQVCFSTNVDGLPTGAEFVCQGWWIITRLTFSNSVLLSLHLTVHNISTIVSLLVRDV